MNSAVVPFLKPLASLSDVIYTTIPMETQTDTEIQTHRLMYVTLTASMHTGVHSATGCTVYDRTPASPQQQIKSVLEYKTYHKETTLVVYRPH